VPLAQGLPIGWSFPRPVIPKPVPKIGLWIETTYQAELKACIQHAAERGSLDGQVLCFLSFRKGVGGDT
jgi:hypothetical protein